MTDEKIEELHREFDELPKGELLIKAYVPGFEELLKAYDSLPKYPRTKVGTLIFKGGPAPRLPVPAGSMGKEIAVAMTALSAQMGALQKSFAIDHLDAIVADAQKEYERGEITPYAFDAIKNRRMEIMLRLEGGK